MKQNKYDDPQLYANYSRMRRSTLGLDEAQEWHAFRALLPDLHDKRLLDLGCGFGWHCRYARQQGARCVIGVDLSENMLARAQAMTDDPAIEYRRCPFCNEGLLRNSRVKGDATDPPCAVVVGPFYAF